VPGSFNAARSSRRFFASLRGAQNDTETRGDAQNDRETRRDAQDDKAMAALNVAEIARGSKRGMARSAHSAARHADGAGLSDLARSSRRFFASLCDAQNDTETRGVTQNDEDGAQRRSG
jgi:hypothetical protein